MWKKAGRILTIGAITAGAFAIGYSVGVKAQIDTEYMKYEMKLEWMERMRQVYPR